MKFRYLKADEIECRVKQVTAKGVSILLYKDARVDQNILDEKVGSMNWQRHHTRDNANCIVAIWDEYKNQWIEKEDTGTESNTEKEKGLASDSFKRACFNWGIGRELYTAPFIWINAADCNIVDGKKCYDKFTVQNFEVTDGKITKLSIINKNTRKVVFSMGDSYVSPNLEQITEQQVKMLQAEIAQCDGVKVEKLLASYKVKSLHDMNIRQYQSCMAILKKYPRKED